ncbi:hypothetical protein [Arthrobacter wenxiniae]|uniref:Uncharacterized protein n=1 Tax=Arthrobacter wenxiniae TaxID=2713570 RepID=A0A7Y7M1U2_9MICC|nr:hypothetical protein [Arthrobacter wenxiniae]NVM97016.1 hypothetical protein [Arthrobacter wenxiniae]
MNGVARCIAAATISLTLSLCGCSAHDVSPGPTVSPLSENPKTTTSSINEIRIITPAYIIETPTPDIKKKYELINSYVNLHPDEFGGSFIPPYDSRTIRIWVTHDKTWESAEFVALRRKLDPEGKTIVLAGEGKSIKFLEDLQERLKDRFFEADSKKITSILFSPEYNAVVVKIRYVKGDPDLNRMPLVIEINNFSKNVVFQSVGADTSGG